MVNTTPQLQRSEADLLVFISSVMNDELQHARSVAEQTIRGIDFGRPWAFEYTPASSEPPTSAYLRKVSEADFVVWLVARETTQPVAEEIQRCMAAGRRLLVFKLAAEKRDSRTMALLQTVSAFAKWQDVQSSCQLGYHIKAALSDEFIRALRTPVDPSRTQELMRNRAESYSRCRVMLRALGIEDGLAAEFANDQGVGKVLKIEGPGLHVVVGPQGSGKSLACHRLFQIAVDSALNDPTQPYPIFIRADEIVRSLRQIIEQRCQGYVNAHVQELMVIVDGIDEQGSRAATMILRDLETYAGANQNSLAVAAVRPLPGIPIDPTAIKIPPLNVEQQRRLIERISGTPLDPHDPRSWPDSIKESVRLPLFAIMIGIWLRTNPKVSNLSVHSLVHNMAQYALQETGHNTAATDELLKRLAARTTTCGAPVYLHDVVASLADLPKLADSRLVFQSRGQIDFSLPIFREWYAAMAIAEGTVAIEDIDLTSDRWTIPIEIVVHSQNTTTARSIMEQVVSKNVNVAAAVLKDYESTSYFDSGSSSDRYEELDIGEQIHRAMRLWQQAMGRLFRVIGPVNKKGELTTLGIKLDNNTVTTAWYQGSDQLAPVVVFSKEDVPMWKGHGKSASDWPSWEMRSIPPTELWSWVITKKHLARNMRKVLNDYQLAYQSEIAVRELAWAFAKAVTGRGTYWGGSIAIRTVLDRIEERLSRSVSVWRTGGQSFSRREIRIVHKQLSDSIRQGERLLFDPWKSSSSNEDRELLERTVRIYEAALDIYRAIVERWFLPFADRIQLYRLLPVRLEGKLSVASERGRRFHAVLSWYPIVLPGGEESTVVFELGGFEDSPLELETCFQVQREAFAQVRKGDVRSVALFRMSRMIDGGAARPATELAHEWLSNDIGDLGWAGT